MAAACLHAARFTLSLRCVRLCRVMKQSLILRWCRLSALAVLVAGGARLGFAVQTSESANTNALTVDEAIHLALANNPELRASGARLDAAAARSFPRRLSGPVRDVFADASCPGLP